MKAKEYRGTASAVIQKLAEMRAELIERYSVTRIGVFGSIARGDDGPESDVDILVELAEPTFDHYMDLKFKLEEVFGRRVDLVMADTIKPAIKDTVQLEVVYA